MAEVYVTKEAQQYSENIISQYLRDAGYDGSLEDGTSLFDVVIRPTGLIYTLFRQDIDKAYAYMSLSKANELKESLSEEDYDAAIDGILSNWFVSRNEGEKITGYVRMWFSSPPSFIAFKEGQSIGTYNGVSLVARIADVFSVSTKSYRAEDFQSRMNTSNNQTEYFIDIPVISNEPTDTKILCDAVIQCSYSDIFFLRGTAASDFTPGATVESSEAFIERTQDAITTRELITRRAFNTVIPDKFPQLSRMYVAGCGDPEMIRDIVNFQDVSVHVGNMADIWVASRMVGISEKCQVMYDDQERAYIELSNSPVHIMSIRDTAPDYYIEGSGEYLDLLTDVWMDTSATGNKTPENQWLIPIGADQEPARLYLNLPTLTSDEEIAWRAEFDTAEGAIREVEVSEITASIARDLQSFLASDANRVASFDPQVKMMVPVVMSFNMRVTVNVTYVDDHAANYDPDATAALVASIKNAVIGYLEDVKHSDGAYIESELVKRIHNEVPEVSVVHLPVVTLATFFNMGTGRFVSVNVQNKFSLDEIPNLSKQITTNTTQYYTDQSLITLELC